MNKTLAATNSFVNSPGDIFALISSRKPEVTHNTNHELTATRTTSSKLTATRATSSELATSRNTSNKLTGSPTNTASGKPATSSSKTSSMETVFSSSPSSISPNPTTSFATESLHSTQSITLSRANLKSKAPGPIIGGATVGAVVTTLIGVMIVMMIQQCRRRGKVALIPTTNTLLDNFLVAELTSQRDLPSAKRLRTESSSGNQSQITFTHSSRTAETAVQRQINMISQRIAAIEAHQREFDGAIVPPGYAS
ncbi:hypothetical protein H2248_003254 [Termitomyces sp. 'cryptogamus']|nr:hypothetical protein H2248_003254 [Termitomyces sp. 'cryptogamus']